MGISAELISAASRLRAAVDRLAFAPPVTHVYNPLDYAREAHQLYLQRYGDSTEKVALLGKNPGGFGHFLPF